MSVGSEMISGSQDVFLHQKLAEAIQSAKSFILVLRSKVSLGKFSIEFDGQLWRAVEEIVNEG